MKGLLVGIFIVLSDEYCPCEERKLYSRIANLVGWWSSSTDIRISPFSLLAIIKVSEISNIERESVINIMIHGSDSNLKES